MIYPKMERGLNLNLEEQAMPPSQNRIEVDQDKTRLTNYIEHIRWQSPNDRFSRFAYETSRGVLIGTDKIYMLPFCLDSIHCIIFKMNRGKSRQI